jgi:UDP-4-amino-4,6-dideoxy-N-acetyl-beta-L-altrosamine transaminase
MINYGKQEITGDDIKSVVKVLKSDFLTQGPAILEFESSLCNYTGAKYSLVTNNCTSALHMACLALGLGRGDIVWTSPITFVASANCARYCGASVDFVDVDANTGLISISKLKEKLKIADNQGSLPNIVIPVHLAGQPCDMKDIYELSVKYKFKIIEDAAHAIGAKYYNENIGNCRYSDITVFSFHPVKIITTGEGGAVMTNDDFLHDKMKLLRSHGITRDLDKISKTDGPWYYEQIMLGYNYRMTDIQASLGNSQLKRLDRYINIRKEIALWYSDKIQNSSIGLKFKILKQKNNRESSNHLFIIQSRESGNNSNFHKQMIDMGIGVNLHYIPVYKQPNFCSTRLLSGAELYYKTSMSLPIFPSIKTHEKQKVIDSLKKILL